MVTIREAIPADMPAVHALVRELAVYEKAEHEVITNPESFVRDGYGQTPLFGCFVAEIEHHIIGISLFYWRFSTWKGKRLYLEDIIVTEKQRGSGAGKLLLERTLQHALDEGCSGAMWQVLDWNEQAINFYKKYDAHFSNEWINVTMESSQIKQFMENSAGKKLDV
jgi:GNAT superfamily N-acetyltransferase